MPPTSGAKEGWRSATGFVVYPAFGLMGEI